jgi:outer membrane protein OmpA-like peptidoglycan-associated protein
MLLSVFTHPKINTPKEIKFPRLTISVLALISLINPQIVSAENTKDNTIKCNSESNFAPCFYVAGGLIGSNVSPKGTVGGWNTSSSSSVGYNLVVGSLLKPHWFGELGYNNLGKAKLKNSSSAITGTESISYSIPSLHIGYLLKPPSETLNYFAKGGVSFIQNSASSDIVPYKKQNSILPSFSAGVQWQSPKNGLFARVSGDYHSSDAMGLNVLLGYKFNTSEKSTPLKPAKKYTKPRRIVKRRPTVVKRRARPVKRRAPARRIANNAPPQLLHIISNIVKQPAFAGVLNGVEFNPRTAILTPRAKGVLKRIAIKLKGQPKMRVAIIGHTDSLGITAENKLLSRSRAASVKKYLIKQGINARRMVAEGQGDSQPRATNSTEGGRRANRRIELRAL